MFCSAMMKGSIDYRNLKEVDIKSTAELCSNVFDGPFGLFQEFERKKSIDMFKNQLEKRKLDYVNEGHQHAMFIAVKKETEKTVGFLEIGLLPNPVLINSKQNDGLNLTSESNNVPYLGNVAIDSTERRKGIATTLIKIGMIITYNYYLINIYESTGLRAAEKWNEKRVYVAVDYDNKEAINLYQKLNFSIVLDETLLISRSKLKKPRLFMAKEIGLKPVI